MKHINVASLFVVSSQPQTRKERKEFKGEEERDSDYKSENINNNNIIWIMVARKVERPS